MAGQYHQRRIGVTIDRVGARNACHHPVADSRKRLCSAAATANEPNRRYWCMNGRSICA